MSGSIFSFLLSGSLYIFFYYNVFSISLRVQINVVLVRNSKNSFAS